MITEEQNMFSLGSGLISCQGGGFSPSPRVCVLSVAAYANIELASISGVAVLCRSCVSPYQIEF